MLSTWPVNILHIMWTATIRYNPFILAFKRIIRLHTKNFRYIVPSLSHNIDFTYFPSSMQNNNHRHTPDTLLLINRHVETGLRISITSSRQSRAQHYVLSSLMTWCRKPARLRFNFPLDKLYTATTSIRCVIHEAWVPASDTIPFPSENYIY